MLCAPTECGIGIGTTVEWVCDVDLVILIRWWYNGIRMLYSLETIHTHINPKICLHTTYIVVVHARWFSTFVCVSYNGEFGCAAWLHLNVMLENIFSFMLPLLRTVFIFSVVQILLPFFFFSFLAPVSFKTEKHITAVCVLYTHTCPTVFFFLSAY